jgi:hypothetical protein
MRTALFLLALAGSARADDAVPVQTLHAFPGIDLLETPQEVWHLHGGPGANLRRAYVSWQVRDDKAHVVVAKRLELLHGGCNVKDWRSRKTLVVTNYAVFAGNDVVAQSRSAATLPAKAGRYQVLLAFADESVYNACDRFEFAMTLEVDGKRIDVELPLNVVRIEPLRRP